MFGGNMATLMEVKFKVRHTVLLLERFTVTELAASTSLNRTSVATEVQRLKRAGFINVVSREKVNKESAGASECVYKLTDDIDKRHVLSDSVEKFIVANKKEEKPTSKHYFEAIKFIDQIIKGSKKEVVFKKAKFHLGFAFQEEDLAENEILQAYLKYERARLAMGENDIDLAKKMFIGSVEVFKKNGNSDMARIVDEHLLALELKVSMDKSTGPEFCDVISGILKKYSLYANPLYVIIEKLPKKLCPIVFEKMIQEEVQAQVAIAVDGLFEKTETKDLSTTIDVQETCLESDQSSTKAALH